MTPKIDSKEEVQLMPLSKDEKKEPEVGISRLSSVNETPDKEVKADAKLSVRPEYHIEEESKILLEDDEPTQASV